MSPHGLTKKDDPCMICNGTWQGCPEVHSKDAVCGECRGRGEVPDPYSYPPPSIPKWIKCPACHGTRKRAEGGGE